MGIRDTDIRGPEIQGTGMTYGYDGYPGYRDMGIRDTDNPATEMALASAI